MLNNKYDPRLKKPDELRQTFANGEPILEELVKSLKPEKGKKLSRQSWIITGARGAGKSHLLALLYYKIKEDKKLSAHWLPLLFPEELFTVDSLYRLMLEIFESVFKKADLPADLREEYLELKKIRITGSLKKKKETRHELAKQLFQLLVRMSAGMKRTIILMLENLQYLLRDQLPVEDVKLLRSFMNEHPGVFVIMGTALTVFDEISDHGQPFYHFFRVRAMGNLEREAIIDFLLKTAAYRDDGEIEGRIESNRRYIYLYQLLTGGNPRLVLFLYELLLDHETLDTYMILEKIMALSPYFLDKTRDESGQRKLILDALATEAPAQTAREIADYVNEDAKSIGEQMKRLAAEGWVRESSIDAEDTRKNEVFYTLRDYFYRLWYRMRTKGIEESDTYCLAELAVFLFDRQEIEERLKKHTGLNNAEARALYSKSLELALSETFMRNIHILLDEAEKIEFAEVMDLFFESINYILKEDWNNFFKASEKLTHYPNGKVLAFMSMEHYHASQGNSEDVIDFIKRAIDNGRGDYKAWYVLGDCHLSLKKYDNAYSAFSESIKFFRLPDKGLYFKGRSDIPSKSSINDVLKEIAGEIFDRSETLRQLLDKNSSIEIQFESLCRLLLLGKFSGVTGVLDQLLEESELPEDGSKKLEYFLEGWILDILKKQEQEPELKTYLKYWVRLVGKRYDEKDARQAFLLFISSHIKTVGKDNVSLEAVENIFEKLHEEGIEISDIVLKIMGAVKNPDSREARQWMTDPLFAEVVERLSGE